jgi:hypothetical protein
MKRGVATALVAIMLFGIGASANSVQASWLSDAWKRLQKSSTTTSSDGSTTIDTKGLKDTTNQSSRWSQVSENQYYRTYIENSTASASGTAQNRYVTVNVKLEFTPLGSQWLGNSSGGRVNPDVITHCFYSARYGVNYCQRGTFGGSHEISIKFYDANGHLIYDGVLYNLSSYQQWGSYTPESEQEQIKNKLFHAAGWDY